MRAPGARRGKPPSRSIVVVCTIVGSVFQAMRLEGKRLGFIDQISACVRGGRACPVSARNIVLANCT